MEVIHMVFLPLLIVLGLISFFHRKKLKGLLLEREKDYSQSINLLPDGTVNNANTSLDLVMLITFGKGKDQIKDGDTLASIDKARIIDSSYYIIFFIYFAILLYSFIPK